MKIIADLIHDSSINIQYTFQGILSFGQIDRSFIVELESTDPPVTTANANQVITNAIEYVKNPSGGNVPVGTAHINYVQCAARYYRGVTIESHTAIEVIVSYIFNSPPWDPTIWTIESDAFTEMIEKDTEWDDDGKQVPIEIKNYYPNWAKPSDPFPTGDAPAPSSFPRATVPTGRRRWTYTKTIYRAPDAVAFDKALSEYIGTVNSTVFTGTTEGATAQNFNYQPGTILCVGGGITFQVYSGQYTGRFQCAFKEEQWNPHLMYYNSQLGGVPDHAWRESDTHAANGMYQAKVLKAKNLNIPLTLL